MRSTGNKGCPQHLVFIPNCPQEASSLPHLLCTWRGLGGVRHYWLAFRMKKQGESKALQGSRAGAARGGCCRLALTPHFIWGRQKQPRSTCEH